MSTQITPGAEQAALEEAIEKIGSGTALAAHLNITKGAVSQWKEEGRKVPAEYCPAIERLSAIHGLCERLRPDVDWAYLRAANPSPH